MLIALPAVAAQLTNKTRQPSNGMPIALFACVVTLKGLPVFWSVNEGKLSECVNGFLQKLKRDFKRVKTLIITI